MAYNFNISLSILNHLGRNLYRSIITILGEAISNSWDADAPTVHVTIDREKNCIEIKDTGLGMSESDFQNKFLKIGYSKRKDGASKTPSGRPFIGRKGIGKLALLSCAHKITILTKTKDGNLTGGIIDNSGLDEAIKDDMSTNEYVLGTPTDDLLKKYSDLEQGTIIIFEDVSDGIRNRVEYLRKLIALYFRFSLIDSNFQIFLNDERITLNELQDLADSTQFLWTIGEIDDSYVTDSLKKNSRLRKSGKLMPSDVRINGFIASVDKPSKLKIRGSDEKVTIDLYVNGRLREKDILRHIPSTRIVENYVYGQIHFNALDDDTDRFTSSREGVVSDDPMFVDFLKVVDTLMKRVIDDWDKWRIEIDKDGDPDNSRYSKKERKSKELVNLITEEYSSGGEASGNKDKVEAWVSSLKGDAQFNVTSYAECFISENLLRKYIEDKSITLPSSVQNKIPDYKNKAERAKEAANISFDIRANDSDLSYLAMDELTYVADKENIDIKKSSLKRDAAEYKPIRDAMCHTSLLTQVAKNKLNSTYENIKAHIIKLLNKS